MMSDQERSLAEMRAGVMKAMGHPSRMYMVGRLAAGEVSVGDLTGEIGADVSTVSKHLSVLKQAGLVADRKDANRVLYRLTCPCIMQFIHCIDDVILQDARKGLRCVLPGPDSRRDFSDSPAGGSGYRS